MNQVVTLKQVREANTALEQSVPSRLGDAVWDVSVAKYHVRRDNGVFLPVEIDHDDDGAARVAQAAEAESLRAGGYQVLSDYE